MDSSLRPQLQSLKVTHVYYNPSDPFSLALAFLALIPQALMVIYVTLIYARREIEVVLMLVGQLLCELVNLILKRVIKEDRPPGKVSQPSDSLPLQVSAVLLRGWRLIGVRVEILGEGYGMPSSHAQFMTFFAVYVTLYLIHRFHSSLIGLTFQDSKNVIMDSPI
jgi:dolichyldiphosphatase